MGRGTILSGGEDGLYSVSLDYGKAQRDAWVAAIDGWIERMNIEIAAAEAGILAAEARTAAADAALQELIGQLGGPPEDIPRVMALIDFATQNYARAQAAEDAVRIPRDKSILERKALVAKKGMVQSALIEETKQAWCVDLTEDATGVVATIEIPGEDQAILIAPGGRAPAAGDGQLMARELMTSEQVFLNAALLPGWQKYKPTYRKGTITFVDAGLNLANVDLDSATSSANTLPINRSPTLTGIPVDYMECSAGAFEVGDRVVVAFTGQNWEFPRVIGFIDHPKPCTWMCIGSSVYGGSTPSFMWIECLDENLISQITAGIGVEVSVWLDGSPVTMMVFVDATGVSSPGFYVEDPTSGPDIRFLVQTNSAANLEGQVAVGEIPAMEHGALGVNLRAQKNQFSDEVDRWETVELMIKIDGVKKLHCAFLEVFEGDPPATQIIGVPIRVWENSALAVTALSSFDFVGV